jgi:hypothetical protein
MAGYFATVAAKLDLDITGFEKNLAKSSETVGKVGTKLESKLIGTKAIATALATAFGLSLHKVIDNVAGLWSGVTEIAREAFKDFQEMSTKNADENIRQMRELVSEEQKYQLLLKERERLLKNPPKADPKGPSGFENFIRFMATQTPLGHLFGPALVSMEAARGQENAALAKKQEGENTAELLKNTAQTAAIDKKRGEALAAANKAEKAAMLSKWDDAGKLAALEEEQLANKKKLLTLEVGTIEHSEMRKNLAEQEVKIDEAKKRLAEEMNREKEKEVREQEKLAELNERVADAMDRVVDAQKDLASAQDEQTATSLDDLAASTSAPGRVGAREVLRLEGRAQWRRAHGFRIGADADIARANKLREGLGALSLKEQDPLAAARDKVQEAISAHTKATAEALKTASVGGGGSGGSRGGELLGGS